MPQIAGYSSIIYQFKEIIPAPSVYKKGIDDLIRLIKEYLPEGPPYFSEDISTDLTERFIASEIIREKAINLTREEIPYSVAVIIDDFKEKKDMVYINATIYVERSSQKGILIGKGGDMLKRIGAGARKDIENLLGCRVYLALWVKVHKNWRKDPKFLEDLGIRGT